MIADRDSREDGAANADPNISTYHDRRVLFGLCRTHIMKCAVNDLYLITDQTMRSNLYPRRRTKPDAFVEEGLIAHD